MVVVAIIGILAAVAIPNFARFTAKSKQSEAKADLAGLYTAERAFQAEWQTFDARFLAVGYAPVGNMRYEHGFSTDVGDALLPPSYNGPHGTAANITTATYCVTDGANACNINQLPQAPGVVAAAAVTQTTMTALAQAFIGGTLEDKWTINELKTLTNTSQGLP